MQSKRQLRFFSIRTNDRTLSHSSAQTTLTRIAAICIPDQLTDTDFVEVTTPMCCPAPHPICLQSINLWRSF